MTRFLTSFVVIDYLPHKDELSDPVVSVTKEASRDEQAVQLATDSSSRNQSLSQGLHPPDPSGSWPRIQTETKNNPEYTPKEKLGSQFPGI